jgi:hypothetical protein
MNLLGIHLTLMIGPDPVATFAPVPVAEALSEVEVMHTDEGRSGFQLTFTIGRSGPFDLIDFGLVSNPLLGVNSRVVLIVTFNAMPSVLMDGIVLRRDISPGDRPGEGRLVLSGQDVSAAMERRNTPAAHPALNKAAIAAFLTLGYPQYLLVPMILPPATDLPPVPIDRVPVQVTDDWTYLQHLAEEGDRVFYIQAGPAPLSNIAYFGPRVRPDIQQKTLSVNVGPESNVTNISFVHDAQAPERIDGLVQDRLTGQTLPVLTPVSTRPPLGLVPDWLRQSSNVRSRAMQTSGLDFAEAMGRAQAYFDRSVDNSITAMGTLDPLRYEGILQARAKVDLRGVGFTFDGTYVVRQVRHLIRAGSYTQDFTISRPDTGPLAPLVRVA